MICPSCSAENTGVDRCADCGYAFWGKQTDSLVVLTSVDRSLKTIKKALIFFVVLVVSGMALWILAWFASIVMRGGRG